MQLFVFFVCFFSLGLKRIQCGSLQTSNDLMEPDNAKEITQLFSAFGNGALTS